MSLVEEYYELNEAEEVSAIWKILQIGLYGIAGIFGLACGFLLGYIRLKFDDRCYLFTDVTQKGNATDQGKRNWESDTWCDYYQYSMVSSFIVGIIWGTLFLMCGKGGKSLTGLPQPWRIVWPSLIFNFIYFIIILCSAVGIQRGTDYFCGRRTFDKIIRSLSMMGICKPLELLLKKDLTQVSLQIDVVVKTAWGCALSWFNLFLLSFFRIVFVVDFHLYKICVFKIDDTVQNKREEVLRITNYEEPRNFDFEKAPSEENPDDLKSGTRKRTKADRKAMRQYFYPSNRLPHKPNITFYDGMDIRMLNRDKKRKKSSKILDEAFGENVNYLGVGLRKSVKTQSLSGVSATSQMSTFFCGYSPELSKEEDDDVYLSSSSSVQEPEVVSGARSDSEILVRNLDSDPVLKLKKQV